MVKEQKKEKAPKILVEYITKEEIEGATDKTLMDQLKYRMQTDVYESVGKKDKRDGVIETIQLELLERAIDRLSLKYGKNVIIRQDTWNTEKHDNQWLITYDGEVKRHVQTPKNEEYDYNEWYDCKIFDGITSVTITNNGETYTLFFILKAVEYKGGSQRNVKQEIGGYTKAIQKNTNNNYHFIFVLDGTYMNTRLNELDKCDKYDLATSETVESVIENFITNKLG